MLGIYIKEGFVFHCFSVDMTIHFNCTVPCSCFTNAVCSSSAAIFSSLSFTASCSSVWAYMMYKKRFLLRNSAENQRKHLHNMTEGGLKCISLELQLAWCGIQKVANYNQNMKDHMQPVSNIMYIHNMCIYILSESR